MRYKIRFGDVLVGEQFYASPTSKYPLVKTETEINTLEISTGIRGCIKRDRFVWQDAEVEVA